MASAVLRLIAATIAVAWISGVAHSQPVCECRGTLVDEYSGGDGQPLSWHYKTYQVSPGSESEPPVFCHFKSVSNDSGSDVWNVNWNVASYARKLIRARMPSPSCPEVPGYLSKTPVNGQLLFGVGDRSYDTKVRPPASEEQALKQSEPINSDIGFFTEGMDSFANVMVSSYVEAVDGKSNLTFTIKNPSEAATSFLVNMPVLSYMAKDLPFTASPQVLKANDSITFVTQTDDKLTLQPAVILFFDESMKNVVSMEKIGVYAPVEGLRPVGDASLWDSVVTDWKKVNIQ